MKYIIIMLSTYLISGIFLNQESKIRRENNQIQEQLYLQTDRPFYKPGEHIWFSTWVIDREKQKSTSLSQMIYVELINPKGKIEEKLKLLANGGRSKGDFHLSGVAPGGVYKLRAYTLWMKNIAEDNYFEKEITVQKVMLPNLLMKLKFIEKGYGAGQKVTAELDLKTLENFPLNNKQIKCEVLLAGKTYKKQLLNTNAEGKALIHFNLPRKLKSPDGVLNISINYQEKIESISRSIPITLKNIILDFFPEGGNFVQGVNSRLAFKATDRYGKPSDIEGQILDENNKVVANFKSFHDGMGSFRITPLPGKKYYARISKPNSLKNIFELPMAENSGYSLEINRFGNNFLKAIINAPKKGNVSIKAQIKGKTYFEKVFKVGKGMNKLEIPINNMPAGVLRVSLFDKKGIGQCERLTFVNKNRTMNIEITTDKEKYLPREKVLMNIKTTDYMGNPISADLALSVVNDNLLTFANDKQNHILSYLLLRAEVKGKIAEPQFYFKKDEPKADKALDYLMMTQAWRKFVWQDSVEIKYSAEKNIVKGRLVDYKKRPFKNHKISILETNDSVFTDNEGYFVIENIRLNPYLTLRALDRKGYKTDIIVKEYVNYVILPDYVRGVVVDQNNKLIINAKITYLGTPINSNTDRLGKFKIPKLKDHKILEINHELYLKKQVIVKDFSSKTIVLEKKENIIVKENTKTQIGKDISKKSKTEKIQPLKNTGKQNPSSVVEILNIVDDEVEIEENINEELILLDADQDEDYEIEIIEITEDEEEEQIFFIAEKMPEFSKGGDLGLRNFIASNVKYPYIAREGCIEGKVYVRFAVDENGNVEKVSILRGIDPVLDKEAMRVVRSMPKWKSGLQRGRKVKVWYTVPINFKLDGGCGPIPEGFYAIFQIAGINQSTSREQKSSVYRGREFYSPVYNKEEIIEQRTDFRSTIYWNPAIITDNEGKAQVSFYNSDEITTFKTITEGISTNGTVGLGEYNYYTQLPFAIKSKMPDFLTFGDKLQIPVTLSNNTDNEITGILRVAQIDALELNGQAVSLQKIKAHETKTIWLYYVVQNIQGKEQINISFESDGLSDAIRKEIEILPKGYSVNLAISSNEKDQKFDFEISDIIPGSLQANFKAYPNVIVDLMQGIESILSEPHGCFEQTSSSTYPNLLVLDYMKSTGNFTASIHDKALSLTKKGYKKLIGFETKQRGYEWFGNVPGHEGLTAYGLMEFTDMAKVYPNVDTEMLKRTKNWLLDKRDGKGGFDASKGKYSFSYASKELKNAYIIYALSESGYFDLGLEYLQSYEHVFNSNDAYKIALVANTAFNMDKNEQGRKLLNVIDNQIDELGFGRLIAKESIVRARGKSLQVETAALYLMAMLKSPNPDVTRIQECTNYIAKARDSHGGFGSTQATVLALRALTSWAKKYNNSKTGGVIEFRLNSRKLLERSYSGVTSAPIIVNGLHTHIKDGKNTFSVKLRHAQDNIPYSLSIQYNTFTPINSDKCIVQLFTRLNHKKVAMGDITRMMVNIKNKSDEYTPMAIAKIGIPSGLSIQPYQLKELLDKKVVDFYEIFDNYLVLYFINLKPAEEIGIPLDLKTELPGTFEAPASSVYLYYTNEFKYWVAGEKVEIRR